jgi:hypothetical protein
VKLAAVVLALWTLGLVAAWLATASAARDGSADDVTFPR